MSHGPAGACWGLPGPTQHGWSTVMCWGQTRVELAYWQRTRRTPELNEMGSGVCVYERWTYTAHSSA